MGIQTMTSQVNGQQSHLQLSPLPRQNSWYNLPLNEVKNQLGYSGKPLGSMNLDELLQNVWTAEANQSPGTANEHMASLQYQASFTLVRALSGKTVDDVWREIQQGQRRRYREMKIQDTEPTLGETTLEDFLVQAGLFAESSFNSIGSESIDKMKPLTLPEMGLSPSPSIGTLSEMSTPGQKRDAGDAFENSFDRRLRRKIKNRESAARSRARKQAYQDELVNKISRLEEEIMKLKREKEFEEGLQSVPSRPQAKYQLRRTSSASF